MKKITSFTAAVLLVVLSSAFTFNASAQYRDDVSYQTFYDELSPHGNWIEYPEHGYVWQPRMGNDFRPYSTGGHWVWSDQYEWMWVSDYDWGWAPFHYGRWFSDPYYGWLWVPGYEWSPAWVAWRDGGDYYGWAPIRPGINISINFNLGGYSPPYDYWCFTPRRYITSRNLHNHYIDRRQNITIINQTTIINNYNYGGGYGFRTGPRRIDAERYVGRINPVRLRDSYNPGRTQFRNNEVSVYRPAFRNDNRNVAPRQFERYDRDNAGRNNRAAGNDNGFRRNNQEAGNDNTVRQQQGNAGRRFDRNNNNGTSQLPRDREIRTQQTDRPVNGNGNRNFERNNRQTVPGDNQVSRPGNPRRSGDDMREPRTRQMDRPVSSQQNPRNFERQRPAERQPSQNREIRSQQQQQRPQMQQQRPQPQQQRPQMQQRPQPQRMERSSGSQPQRNNGGGNGRFERRTN